MLRTYNKIAFCGEQRAGKDTAAEYCKLYLDFYKDSKILKFADPLYELTEIIQRHLNFPVEKDRLLLQYLGTEYARQKDPNIWLNIFKQAVENINGEVPILVTDGRFMNELVCLKEQGFLMVRILRPLEERIKYGAKGMDHASEKDVSIFTDWDITINNDSSIEDYQTELYNLFK